MGAYINPPTMTKEKWLEKNAEELEDAPYDIDTIPGYLPVCLVENAGFTAAAIAYDNLELTQFSDPADTRPKRWFLAKETDLNQVSRELPRYRARVKEERP